MARRERSRRRVRRGSTPPPPEGTGILETHSDGYGFIRPMIHNIPRSDWDPFVSEATIQRYRLRAGCIVDYRAVSGDQGGLKVARVEGVNGVHPDEWKFCKRFDEYAVIQPEEQLVLETGKEDICNRAIDLVSPIGRGQRGLIVSPPKAGKTMILQGIARSIATNYPDMQLIVLLIDERPEEVTDMRRTVDGLVFASCNDQEQNEHVRVAQLGIEVAKRYVEAGKDVMVLIDSLTRLGRTFNLEQKGSGRTMTGGLDARALEVPRRLFGAARNLEGGGSMTIIATILVGTNSRMDEFIFQEFKGTGNMELVLTRDLSDLWIYPAINLLESSTRKVELLVGRNLSKYQTLRRYLLGLKNPKDAIEALIEGFRKTESNKELLEQLRAG